MMTSTKGSSSRRKDGGGGGEGVRLERPKHLQNSMHLQILRSQQTDDVEDLADTLMVCHGGTIKVHAFLMQAASPFLQKMFQSQGENYPFVREILLPDFSIKEIEKMVQLIYKGYIDLKSSEESKELQGTLKFFQVVSVGLGSKSSMKNDRFPGSLKIQESNRIPQDIFKHERLVPDTQKKNDDFKPEVVVEVEVLESDMKPKVGKDRAVKLKTTDASASTSTTPKKDEEFKFTPPLRRSGRAQKPCLRLGNVGGESLKKEGDGDDKDYKVSSEEEDDSCSSGGEGGNDNNWSGDDGRSPRKRGRRGKRSNQKPEKVENLTKTSSNTITESSRPASVEKVETTTKNMMNGDSGKNDEDEATNNESGTDSEEETWVTPNYKDTEWFIRESRRCQGCNKSFEKPAEAALCITSHKNLRCYFCFHSYSSTDILFKHFRKRHKQAGRESSLICPYCDQAVPYKSVSCHMISVHLKTKTEPEDESDQTKSAASRYENSSQSSSGERGSSSERPAKKMKFKTERSSSVSPSKLNKKERKKKVKKVYVPLQVPNLDITIEKLMFNGKAVSFRLQKIRPRLEVAPGTT